MCDDPDHARSKRWHKFICLSAGCMIVFALGFGLFFGTGLVPATGVLSGSNMPTNQIAHLLKKAIIDPNEEILLFYSGGLVSISEDGSVLTNRRVISYQEHEGDLGIDTAAFVEIADVVILEAGDDYLDTMIEIKTVDGRTFRLALATEGGGDTRFLGEIQRRMTGRSVDTIAKRQAPG